MGGLSNHFIWDFLNSLNLNLFKGVFSANNIPPQLKETSRCVNICDLSDVDRPGTHFISIVKNKTSVIILDPLALPNTYYLKILEFLKPLKSLMLILHRYNLLLCIFAGFIVYTMFYYSIFRRKKYNHLQKIV